MADMKKPSAMRSQVLTKPIAPAIPELTPQQEVALLARCLHAEGYDDHLAGHISYKQDDGTFLCNPFGMTWDELRGQDIMRMDGDGNEIGGQWTITPAIQLHVQIHKARPDVHVSIHNHSRWGTIWADMGRAPEIYDQTGAFYHGKVAIYDEYWGAVDDEANAKAIVEVMGDANVGLLQNHGVVILADNIHQAYLRAIAFEWRCEQAWRIAAAGGGRPMNPAAAENYGDFFNTKNFRGLFEAMVRKQLRRDPSVLE